MKYVIEVTNGNPKILKINEDGTYSIIGFGAGENNLKEFQELVNQANLVRPIDR